MTTDPVSSKLDKLKAARSSDEVILQSYSTEDNVLRGLNSSNAIRSTMSQWLSEIKDDSRTHMQVATCTKYTLFGILPSIWASAVIYMSKAQGFASELLHMGLVSNLSYVDHNETKLRVKGPFDDGHAVNSDIALVLGNTASSKKSLLENYLKTLVSHHSDNQNKNIPKVSLGNGTIKRIRTRKCKLCEHDFL